MSKPDMLAYITIIKNMAKANLYYEAAEEGRERAGGLHPFWQNYIQVVNPKLDVEATGRSGAA